MIYEDIYIRSQNEKIALSIFYKNEKIKNSSKEKPCIVFLPGTMANPYTYWNFLEKMVLYDIVVIGVNYIGHGKSSRNKKDYNINDLKQNTIDALKYVSDNLEKYGKYICLFGHSQGGMLVSLIPGSLSDDIEKNLKTYIFGNFVISTQKGLKKIVGLNKVPDILIPLIKFGVGIYGKIFKKKMLKFSDYVKIIENKDKKKENSLEEKTQDEIKEEVKDPLRVDEYPFSMVSSLFNINTNNLTNPKKEIKQKVVVIAVSNDPVFPYELQEEAFNMLSVKNKKLIKIESDVHMIYTELPKKMSQIIFNEI